MVFCGHLYMAPLAVLVARWHRARLIVQMHGIEAWSRPGRLQQRAVEAADLILCVSRYTRARVIEWAAIAPERVLVLPNTVGQAFTPGDGSALRRAWGLQDKRVLLTVGRMDAREGYKGHDRVIAALPQLLAAGHDLVYVVAGEGDDRTRLQNLAAERGVAERVRFVGVLGQDCPRRRLSDGRSLRHALQRRRLWHRLPGSHGLRHACAWASRRRGSRCIGRRRIRNHGVGGRVRFRAGARYL